MTDPISALRDDLDGRVIAPDDPGYDDARALFFAGFDRRPAAVVRASSADDVARVVSFARSTGAELAVRSGGHSGAGHSTTDGGIVLDLADMRALDIDEMQIHVAPVLLGRGIRLFDHLGTEHVAMEATRVIESPAVTHLRYRVIRGEHAT